VIELSPVGIGQVAPAIEAARWDGMKRLVVAGGDGLLHHALPAVADTEVAVGIVPIGTGNDFARALGLDDDIEIAVDAALSDPSPIDLIAADPVSGEPTAWAASVVTGGFSGRATERANRLLFLRGQQRYTIAALLELAALKPMELTLDLDGTVHQLDATLFAIGNTRYFGGGMAICPDARPDDGLLHVTVIGAASRLTFARVLPTVFSGRHVDHPGVQTFRARCVGVTVDCDLWADGERFINEPFRAAPAALNVAGSLGAVPQGFE
jgi:diacylglycerol kinase (ATP)